MGSPKKKLGRVSPALYIYDAPETTWFPATAEIANVCWFEARSKSVGFNDDRTRFLTVAALKERDLDYCFTSILT
jgi:hypothetical protein